MALGEGTDRTNQSPRGSGNNDPSAPSATSSSLVPAKRTRVLLSCHACRSSKLKCDRATPCGQCLKKGKADFCAYAARPEKVKPSKSMAARLKRLEGMVRGMVEIDGTVNGDSTGPSDIFQRQQATGSVVHGERATNYVGGTHFMAILEDLEDLKTYFEDTDASDLDIDESYENSGPGELLLLPSRQPRNKQELLALLPDKSVMDRLMNRYFNSNSPSQHIIHFPTFSKQYNDFLANRDSTDIHWIGLLFMVLALGVFFSSFQAPHELLIDSTMPAMDRFRKYRGACGWALVWGKYSQPGRYTLQAFLLYTEGEFLVNRVTQMNCYLLCSTLIRLMLKMGLHRDPSKLPRISPYEGEMRRRIWNLAIQIDLLVSFHLGLPCMIHGIESDTALPRNLVDTDFNEDSRELPQSRPMSEYTPLTYAINKARISRCFGLVARLSHSLTLPTYAEIMRVDSRLQDVWSGVPSFMMVKPLSECITDAPMLVIQRFGLAALYQKSRCVLHRRYLVEPRQLKEHEYSRRTCVEAALALLAYQDTMFEATKPGAILAQNGWFIASLAVNDFLLADMIIALVVQQLNDDDNGLGWLTNCTPSANKESLIETLKNSYAIWSDMAKTIPDCQKAATVVRTMLGRIETQLGTRLETGSSVDDSIRTGSESATSHDELTSLLTGTTTGSGGTYSSPEGYTCTTKNNDPGPPLEAFTDFGMEDVHFGRVEDNIHIGVQQRGNIANPWEIPQVGNGYDWDQFDAMTRGPTDMTPQIPQIPPLTQQNWLDQNDYNEFADFQAYNSWNTFPDF
ncbi:hypothetical protein GGS20DRAFT_578725 [Poronia punctata]|nr:hypothetical protein GGS20DRAFT_578725 [Poronia punctata]